MSDHILTRAKAYCALIGSVCTALLGIYATGQVGHVLTVIAAVATAVSTYAVPNADSTATPDESGAVSLDLIVGVLLGALGLFLVLFLSGRI